jgi:predicted ATPase/class 3 adenylate cyclase/DNA-binding CsgD family transcriptional regulator
LAGTEGTSDDAPLELAMSVLPSGTVTFLFTDIEGSTRLLQSLGDAYTGVLADHHRLLRSAVTAHGGREIDSQGDAFFFVLPRARDALEAALEAQRSLHAHRWPEDVTLQIRIGLHTGEPIEAGGRFVGMDVHRAARICDAAHGGQILLSQTTRALVEDDLPDGVSLRDLGEWRLKDLARPQRLFQTVVSDLPSEFPAPRTLESFPNNLPRQFTSFVGREQVGAEIKSLLHQTVLLTLTGVGGSGKTRLALQVAAEVLDRYPDGVWWVELGPLTEPGLLPQTVASALAIREQRGRTATDVVLDYLTHRSLLLVLDNIEHLLEPCALLVAMLLRRCPGVRLMTTGREPLRVPGEHIYAVSPLSFPESGLFVPLPTLSRYEAVRLFADRAVGARPSFAVTEQNAAAVLEICRRVDGIPLALELAAARVKVLSAEQIASRLGDQFAAVTGGSTGHLPRHQTLWATMDWSHDLLSDSERNLFGRLGVFAGSFGLDAVEAVASGNGLDASGIVDLLIRLVEKSLVMTQDGGTEVRYRLLEPVRQYARSKLAESGESGKLAERHRDFFLALAEHGYAGLAGPQRLIWRGRIESDHDNIRAALRWSIDDEQLEPAVLLGAAMARFWAARGFLTEGWSWLNELKRYESSVSAYARARLLSGLGLLAFEIGEHEQAEITEQALRIFEGLGDHEQVEICTRLLGMVELERGKYEHAAAMLERAAALARGRGDLIAEAETLRQRGYLAAKQAEYPLAIHLLEQSLATLKPTGMRRSIGFTLGHLAQTYHYQGNSQQAIAMLEEALGHLEAAEHGTGIAYFRNVLGLVLVQSGELSRAAQMYHRCLVFARETGYRWAVAQSLIGAGALEVAAGHAASAVRLLSAAGALLQKIDYAIPAAELAYMQRLIEGLRRTMPGRLFGEAWESGQRMVMEEAISHGERVLAGETALSSSTGSRKPAAARTPSPKQSVGGLSPRERQVAALVAEGRTNRDIAETLGITEKTANTHLQNILNKLGFTSRAQIAAWAGARGLVKEFPTP